MNTYSLMRAASNPHWFADVRVGSVIREKNGPFRVVREVSRYQDGGLRSVTVVIRKQSWTGRCYTILGRTNLIHRGFRLVPNVRVKPKTLLDVRIHQAIHQPCDQPYIITANEVVSLGVA